MNAIDVQAYVVGPHYRQAVDVVQVGVAVGAQHVTRLGQTLAHQLQGHARSTLCGLIRRMADG